MDGEVYRTPDRRSENPATHPEMAGRWGLGERDVVEFGDGDTPRGDDFAAPCKRVPALRARSLDPAMAQASRARRRSRRALCRRFRDGLSARVRRGGVSSRSRSATAAVRVGVAPRENAPDLLREVRPKLAACAWRGEAGDIRF